MAGTVTVPAMPNPGAHGAFPRIATPRPEPVTYRGSTFVGAATDAPWWTNVRTPPAGGPAWRGSTSKLPARLELCLRRGFVIEPGTSLKIFTSCSLCGFYSRAARPVLRC